MGTATTTDFLSALRQRRSLYALKKGSPISDERIRQLLEEALTHTPSAFNSQTTRLVLLLGAEHDRLWEITREVLKAIVPEDQFAATNERIQGFQNAYGTILFFEDMAIIEHLQEQFPLYQDRFPVWAQHTNAMHQIVVWMLLESEGLGASLQHYNPLIDERVKAQWNLPESWQLVAQMPFGTPSAPPRDKEIKPLETRLRVFGH